MTDKITIEEVANSFELPLLTSLECPIDSMISLNPVMCVKCETLFCPDCIENWKKRSNVCPMRCSPFEVTNIDRHILKNQIAKIKFACPNHKNGCISLLPINEVSRHEKVCEYREIKCEKCEEKVPSIAINNHFYEECSGLRIPCFICKELCNLKSLRKHLESCSVNKLCSECCYTAHANGDNSECLMKISECGNCSLPEFNQEMQNHRCVSEEGQILSNLNAYLKSILSRYEEYVNRIVAGQDENFKEYNKKLNELTSDFLKYENDKHKSSELRLFKISDEYGRRLMITKKDRVDSIKKLRNEINDLSENLESKNKELVFIDSLYDTNLTLLKNEYELKIESKRKSLEYLRNLILVGCQAKHSESSPNLKSQSSMISVAENSSRCHSCQNSNPNDMTNCGNCNLTICSKCSSKCTNTSYDHLNNNYCKNCFASCIMCNKVSLCKFCIKKCFYRGCDNTLCQSCIEKNKHQLRTENVNCRFYKCESCQTDANCIMTTIYCAPCDRRVCRNCFLTTHISHKK